MYCNTITTADAQKSAAAAMRMSKAPGHAARADADLQHTLLDCDSTSSRRGDQVPIDVTSSNAGVVRTGVW